VTSASVIFTSLKVHSSGEHGLLYSSTTQMQYKLCCLLLFKTKSHETTMTSESSTSTSIHICCTLHIKFGSFDDIKNMFNLSCPLEAKAQNATVT